MDVHTELDGGEFVVSLQLHGEPYDEEVYKVSEGSFSLASGGGEAYEVPIPLLKFPMNVGETWEWQGKAIAADVTTPAKATVTSAEEQVFVCGVPVQAVRTEVKLSIKPRGSASIQRQMTFYFAQKRGLFKRAWGSTSIREPDCP
jgi:hypothetical protein